MRNSYIYKWICALVYCMQVWIQVFMQRAVNHVIMQSSQMVSAGAFKATRAKDQCVPRVATNIGSGAPERTRVR